MAGQFTTVGANRALDRVFRQAGETLYLGLATAPLDDNSTLASITELTTSGYTREVIAFAAPTGDPSLISNTAEIRFGPLVDDPPAVAHAFVTDAASGTTGTILAYWSGTIVDAVAEESITVPVGNLTFTLD